MSDFVHLHLHSEYSLLESACRIRDIPDKASACGHGAVAITDSGVLYGVPAFYDACLAKGIRPIIGCEMPVRPSGMPSGNPSAPDTGAFDRIVLLCRDLTGYKNLMALSTLSFTGAGNGGPGIDFETLKSRCEGLIALSGGPDGRVCSLLESGDYAGAKALVLAYRDAFGPDNYYLEVQNHGLGEERQLLAMTARLSRETAVPPVATNNCYYINRADAETRRILRAIATNTTVNDNTPDGLKTDEYYYKTTQEMYALFPTLPEAVENAAKIADRCRLELDFGNTYLPKYPCPPGTDAVGYLSELTYRGLSDRVESGHVVFSEQYPESAYRDRLAYELSVIDTMGYADYYLIVRDYVAFAKSRRIPVGPGRGSGAGSLVAFCIGITEIDSLTHNLIFERFLNPERVSMPDFDIDFCYNRRDEVIAYVTEKYGRDRVSQIITFDTMAARAAVRDCGRAMGLPLKDVDTVAKAIPRDLGITLEDALKTPDLKTLVEASEQNRRLVQAARAIEGMPRNPSVHAAGIVITDRPVSEYVPLSLCNDTRVTQYDMNMVARAGILKFDFLALRYLTVIHDAETLVRQDLPSFRIEDIPLDDADVYSLIAAGDTVGVFQMEKAGMRRTLTGLKPQNIEDIQAAIALYRPGPMSSIPTYILNKQNPDAIVYPSPLLEPVLKETYGVTVYQEQVMSIFRVLAGYSYGHADIVRRAMAKKKMAALESERTAFIDGAVSRGMSMESAQKLFDDMLAFANYAFNKSHAAAYAVITYQTAYLKTHYPCAYYSALLTSVLGDKSKVSEYTDDAAKRGIRVLAPDVNRSREYFHTSESDGRSCIRYGLLAINNVGGPLVDAILTARDADGPFASFDALLDRIPAKCLNRRQIEVLIKSGACDCFETHRAQMLAVYEEMIERRQTVRHDRMEGQIDLFSSGNFDVGPSAAIPPVEYPDMPPFSHKELLMLEKQATGMFFSGQLLDDYQLCLSSLNTSPIASYLGSDDLTDEDIGTEPGTAPSLSDRMPVRIGGLITSCTVRLTKKQEKMAVFSLEDASGAIECLVFSKTLANYESCLSEDAAVYVEGTLSVRDGEPNKVFVSVVSELVENSRIGTAAQPAKQTGTAGTGTSVTSAGAADVKPSNSAAQSANAAPPAPDVPKKPKSSYGFNPYLTRTVTKPVEDGAKAPAQNEPEPSARKNPAGDTPSKAQKPTRLFVRVPDMTGTKFLKVRNLTEIFCDGNTDVIYYDVSTGKYVPSGVKIAATDFVLTRIRAIVGEESAVLR